MRSGAPIVTLRVWLLRRRELKFEPWNQIICRWTVWLSRKRELKCVGKTRAGKDTLWYGFYAKENWNRRRIALDTVSGGYGFYAKENCNSKSGFWRYRDMLGMAFTQKRIEICAKCAFRIDFSGLAFTQKRIEISGCKIRTHYCVGLAFTQKRIEIEPGRLDIRLDGDMAFIQKRIEIRLQSWDHPAIMVWLSSRRELK